MDLKHEICSATDYIDPCKEGVACKHLPGNKSSEELMFIREQVSGGGTADPLIPPGRRILPQKILCHPRKEYTYAKLHVYFKASCVCIIKTTISTLPPRTSSTPQLVTAWVLI